MDEIQKAQKALLPKKDEKEPHFDTIICAPHPDDEIIGAYKYLTNPVVRPIVIYSGDLDGERKEAALKLKDHVDCKLQLFQMTVPQAFLAPTNRFLMPDPIYETHPKHRYWGMIGESMARGGLNVIFYSTIMNAPYIHEVEKPNEKLELLEKVYPDQKSLWEFDHKYYLFEGYNKWIF